MNLIEPWQVLDGDEKLKLENELRKEIHYNHILFNQDFILVGKRIDRDDVLLKFIDNDSLAVVHLTFKASPEEGPWPSTRILSVSEFQKEMNTENEVW